MPVNNFEKQVQQKMDELQLRPSAEVWQEVEKRIRKEKKRRGMILFILSGVLLLGGTGWWLTTRDKITFSSATVAETKNENNESKSAIPESKDDNAEKLTTAEFESKQVDKKEIIKNNTSGNSTVAEEKTGTDKKLIVPVFRINNIKETSATASIITEVKNKKQKAGEKVNTETIKALEDASGKNKKNENVPVSADDIVTTATVNEQIVDSAKKEDVAINNVSPEKELIKDTASAQNDIATNTTTAKNNPYPIVSDSNATPKTETPAKENKNKAKGNKWELGIIAVIGVSNKAKDLQVFGMNKSLSDYNSTPSATPGQPQSTRPVPYLLPANPEKGNFWQIGMYAKRKFSAKNGLSVGLNFSSYSTIQQTGVYADPGLVVNSSIPGRSYYTSGTTGTLYTNHYYYLQMPIAFHWQLNKGNKLPITWQNGFSTGLFLGGDALVYNSRSNVFYKDNKSFNKVQLSYQSGLYVKLFNQRKHPLTAGVLVNYHLNKFQNANIYGGNHLSSFGFQLGWLLKK